MTYSFEETDLPGVVWVDMSPGFQMRRDLHPLIDDVLPRFDAVGGPIIHVVDVQDVSFSYADLSHILTTAYRTERNPLLHPDLVELLVITNSYLAQGAVTAINATLYRRKKIWTLSTAAEAHAYVRGRVVSQQHT